MSLNYVVEARIPVQHLANILHYLNDVHNIKPVKKAELLRTALELLNTMVPKMFNSDETAAAFIEAHIPNKHRADRFTKAAKGLALPTERMLTDEILDAIKKNLTEPISETESNPNEEPNKTHLGLKNEPRKKE